MPSAGKFTTIILTNNTRFAVKKRLFYTPAGWSQGDTCTQTDATFALTNPYTFTSGITITLSNGVSIFVNLAGQTLTSTQISTILNNTPSVNAYAIWFGDTVGSPFTIMCYAQSTTAYVTSMSLDATVGSPGITFGAAFPITAVVPGGLTNLENSIKFIPAKANNIYLFGSWVDVNQSTQYFMNEYWGEYVWTTEPLVPQMDPYARQIIADLLHLHGPILLDGNTGIDLAVSANQTLTLWIKLEIIHNNTLILQTNATASDSRTNRELSM